MITSYLARIAATSLRSVGRRRLGPLEEMRLPVRAWPTDIDIYLHVNNGRYLTLMDFGRLQLTIRSGLLPILLRRGWRPVVGGATVRFLHELRAFQRFEVVTRIACWDGKWIYLEQRFESGGQVCATGFVRAVFKQGRRTVTPTEILAALGFEGASPEPSPELARWIAAAPPLEHVARPPETRV